MYRYVNFPNCLSLSRVFIACVILLFGYSLSPAVMAWLVLFAVISDVFDGYLARVFRCQSTFGAQLDPICDAFFVIGLIYYVLCREQLSFYYLLFLLIRYGVILLYHCDLKLNQHQNLASLWTGKWSSGLMMGCLVYYFVNQMGLSFPILDILFPFLIVVTGVMMIVSWYFYYLRYIHLMSR